MPDPMSSTSSQMNPQPLTKEERRYRKEFIPASVSQDGRGHWRIADGEDNRVATCWDSYNADRIVAALNEQWNRAELESGRSSPEPTREELLRAVQAFMGWAADFNPGDVWLEHDAMAKNIRLALVADRRRRSSPEAPAADLLTASEVVTMHAERIADDEQARRFYELAKRLQARSATAPQDSDYDRWEHPGFGGTTLHPIEPEQTKQWDLSARPVTQREETR